MYGSEKRTATPNRNSQRRRQERGGVRGNWGSGDPTSGDGSRGAPDRTADLRVQLLPDTSSRWPKGPSASGRGQLVLQRRPLLSEHCRDPPPHPRKVSDPAVLQVQLQAAPCLPLQADSISGQQGLPAAPSLSEGPRGRGTRLDTACSRLLTVSLPLWRRGCALKRPRAGRVQAPPHPDTSHLQPAGPGLCSSLACKPLPSPPALPSVTPGRSSDFKAMLTSWISGVKSNSLKMYSLSPMDLARSIPVIIILDLLFHSTMSACLSHWTLSS